MKNENNKKREYLDQLWPWLSTDMPRSSRSQPLPASSVDNVDFGTIQSYYGIMKAILMGIFWQSCLQQAGSIRDGRLLGFMFRLKGRLPLWRAAQFCNGDGRLPAGRASGLLLRDVAEVAIRSDLEQIAGLPYYGT